MNKEDGIAKGRIVMAPTEKSAKEGTQRTHRVRSVWKRRCKRLITKSLTVSRIPPQPGNGVFFNGKLPYAYNERSGAHNGELDMGMGRRNDWRIGVAVGIAWTVNDRTVLDRPNCMAERNYAERRL